MSRRVAVRLLLAGFVIAALFTGCTRDPNVRKQKYLEAATAIVPKANIAKRSLSIRMPFKSIPASRKRATRWARRASS